jgi:hypothetical protein
VTIRKIISWDFPGVNDENPEERPSRTADPSAKTRTGDYRARRSDNFSVATFCSHLAVNAMLDADILFPFFFHDYIQYVQAIARTIP